MEQGLDSYGRITQMVNLPIEYSDKPVTPYGGIVVLPSKLDKSQC
jgi:hypothetical protein